jgi:hypothetical protein
MRSSGKEIDFISKKAMKDQPIDQSLLKSGFESDLADLGVTIKTVVEDGKSRRVVSLKGSRRMINQLLGETVPGLQSCQRDGTATA